MPMPICLGSLPSCHRGLFKSNVIVPSAASCKRSLRSETASGSSGNHTPGFVLPPSIALTNAPTQMLQTSNRPKWERLKVVPRALYSSRISWSRQPKSSTISQAKYSYQNDRTVRELVLPQEEGLLRQGSRGQTGHCLTLLQTLGRNFGRTRRSHWGTCEWKGQQQWCRQPSQPPLAYPPFHRQKGPQLSPKALTAWLTT